MFYQTEGGRLHSIRTGGICLHAIPCHQSKLVFFEITCAIFRATWLSPSQICHVTFPHHKTISLDIVNIPNFWLSHSQLGDSKEPVRKSVHSLFNELCYIYPASRTFFHLSEGINNTVNLRSVWRIYSENSMIN